MSFFSKYFLALDDYYQWMSVSGKSPHTITSYKRYLSAAEKFLCPGNPAKKKASCDRADTSNRGSTEKNGDGEKKKYASSRFSAYEMSRSPNQNDQFERTVDGNKGFSNDVFGRIEKIPAFHHQLRLGRFASRGRSFLSQSMHLPPILLTVENQRKVFWPVAKTGKLEKK